MRSDKLLIFSGLFLFSAGFLLSLLVSYLVLPREKAVITLQLPGSPAGEVLLGEGVAEKLYFNVSARGDRHIQLRATFFNERGEPVGGFYVEYTGVNSSGWLVLPESPYSVQAVSSCTACRSTVEVTLYYSRFNRGEVNALSLASAAASLLGMSLLAGGLYSYVVRKYAARPRGEGESASSPEGSPS
jgi:hypothetical protein